VRLLWRMTGGARVAFLVVMSLLFLLPAHVAAWAVMRNFDLERMLDARPGFVIFTTLFMMLLALSSAFGLAVNALFGRGDMDLLVSSPVPIRNVYMVRAMAVGFASVSLWAFFWMPIADTGPLHGRWGTLAGYPVFLSIGLMCAALAFAVTLGLVSLLGPRRAHVAAQVVGAFAGAFLVLGLQFETVLPRAAQAAISDWLASERSAAWFGPHSVLTWPARALFGDPLPLIATLTLCLGVFVLVVRLTTVAFASAVQDGSALTPNRYRNIRKQAFASGLARIVIAKELKLIARDPTLIAKSLVQLLYFIPLMLIVARHAELAGILAASLVILAANLAGTLAWITVSGEEAPDLVGSAPVTAERVRWFKVAAALAPVVALLLPFLAWYAVQSPRIFPVLAACLAAALASSAVIQVWTGKPNPSRDLRVRHKQNRLVNSVEALCSFGWAAACYLVVAGHWLGAAAAVVVGLAGPATAWFVARMREGD
jgi:ABC-2 type transport system permease protein